MKSIDRKIATFFDKTFVPRKIFPLLLLFLLSLAALHAFIIGKTVYGDGIYYFSWVRSLVVDRNIDFTNEFSHFGVTAQQSILGIPINKFSVGPSVFWSLLYLPLHTILNGSGFEFPYELIVAFSSVLLGFVGLLLIYRMLLESIDERSALATIVTLTCATPFLFYGAIDPVNSHAVAFFVCSLFLSYAFQRKPHAFISGFLLGVVGLTRPMDMLIGLSVIFLFRKKILLFLGGCIIGFLPQMVLWYIQTGNILTTTYAMNKEGFTLLSPHVIETLFSPIYGIFTTSPIIFITLVGFFLPWKQTRLNKYAVEVTLVLAIYLLSSWSTYWQGATYGNRMFLSFLPLCAFPLASFLSLLTKRLSLAYTLLTTTLPFSFFNAIAIIIFLSSK